MSRPTTLAQWYDAVYFFRVAAEWPSVRIEYREHRSRTWRTVKDNDMCRLALLALADAVAADVVEIRQARV